MEADVTESNNSYFRVDNADLDEQQEEKRPPLIPLHAYPSDSVVIQVEEEAHDVVVAPWKTIEVKKDGSKRYCSKCNQLKPDRSHHCSGCNACTLKMDHHCPWVCNCVGFGNYKYFVQFVAYGSTYCLVLFVICCFSLQGMLGEQKVYIFWLKI